jgi:hypothetical protein
VKHTIDNRGFVSEKADPFSLTIKGNTTFEGSVTLSGSISMGDYTYHQLYVDLSGSDTLGNGASIKPYRTISKALSVASASGPTLAKPFGIVVGAGTFEENPLVFPVYTGLYGRGSGATKIKPASSGTVLITLTTRNRLEACTLTGINTGSNNIGIDSTTSGISYIDAPRIQNVTIRDFSTGVRINSGSALNCFDIKAWNNSIGFDFENAASADLYNCSAYQIDNPLASGSHGLRAVGQTESQYIFLFAFNTWNNETAISVAGVSGSGGCLAYGANIAFESEGTVIKVDNSAFVDLSDTWSKNCINSEVSQLAATARIKLRNAQLDYSKLNTIVGGEANFTLFGVDTNTPEIVRTRGPNPAFQLRSTTREVVSGGLWRIATDNGHFCIERNTHPSGAFATYSEDFVVDATGSVGIGLGDATQPFNKLDVLGNLGIRNDGLLKFYEPLATGASKYTSIRSPASMSQNVNYVLPDNYPGGSWFLTSSATGEMGWTPGGGGEANSGSNLGTGVGVYKDKLGLALEFKSLVGGSGIVVSGSATEVFLSCSVSGSNLGSGFGVYSTASLNAIDFKSLVAGTNIGLSSSATEITISSSAEINSGSNLGAGEGVYSGKTGVALNFKSLKAGTGLTVSSTATEITFDNAGTGEANSGSNIGTGVGVYSGKTGIALNFKTLKAGSNITLSASSTEVTIDATTGSVSVVSGNNLDTNWGLYVDRVGTALNFKTLVSGTNISFTSSSTGITINTSAEANSGSNLGTGVGIYRDKTGVALNFKGLLTSGSVTLSASSTDVTIGTPNLSGSNLGSGYPVYHTRAGDFLQFNTIQALTNSLGCDLYVTQSTNNLQISTRPVKKTSTLYDDFQSSNNVGSIGWLATVNGAGAVVQASSVGVNTTFNAAGVFNLTTGTNAAGRSAISTFVGAYKLDAYESTILEWKMWVDALSTATQEYRVDIGWINVPGAGAQTSGVYFEYSRAVSGDVWRICAANGGSISATATAVAVAASTLYKLRIETNTGCTLATYYINDVNVGTLNTNLPNSAGQVVGIGARIDKSAGTTARNVYLDYMQCMLNWATAR